jgi:hypothetical protein
MFATDWSSLSTILSGLAIFVGAAIVPIVMLFHRRVVKPLSFVLGLKKEDSPTGEAIPNIPTQLASIRAELHPNGGSSMRDSVDRAEKTAHEVQVRVINLESAVRIRDAENSTRFEVIGKTLDALLAGQASAARTAKETLEGKSQ